MVLDTSTTLLSSAMCVAWGDIRVQNHNYVVGVTNTTAKRTSTENKSRATGVRTWYGLSTVATEHSVLTAVDTRRMSRQRVLIEDRTPEAPGVRRPTLSTPEQHQVLE